MASPSSSESNPPPPLRLSILHLMMWMTGSALLATYLRDFPTERMPTAIRPVIQTLQLVFAFVGGVQIASVGLLAQYGFKKPWRFPREPGHWWLLSQGVGICLGILARWYAMLRMNSSDYSQYAQHHFIAALTIGVVVVLYLGYREQKSPFWRLVFGIEFFFFGVIAANSLIFAFESQRTSSLLSTFIFGSANLNRMALGAVLLGRLIFELLQTPPPHDWLHRVALFTAIISGVNAAVAVFVIPLLQN